MPIYEYQCTACDHSLEALQKMSDDVLIHCPECNGETLKKKISAVAFQLKGTGWYETDFKNGGSKAKAVEGGQSGKPDTAKASKSDTKGAAKSGTTKTKAA